MQPIAVVPEDWSVFSNQGHCGLSLWNRVKAAAAGVADEAAWFFFIASCWNCRTCNWFCSKVRLSINAMLVIFLPAGPLLALHVQKKWRDLTRSVFSNSELEARTGRVTSNTNVLRLGAKDFPITRRRISRGRGIGRRRSGDCQGKGLNIRSEFLDGLRGRITHAGSRRAEI